MKLNLTLTLLLSLLLSAAVSSNAGAQEWRWHRWGKCGYSLCKEDTAGMSKRGEDCHYCHACCYHRGFLGLGRGWGWGWHGCCGGNDYYYESLHKDCHHECSKTESKDAKKEGNHDCQDGHRYYHHWDCCSDRYYYRGGGY